MRSYRNDGNLIFFRAVVPEYSVSSRGALLSIGLEYLFALRTLEEGKFMRSEARMSRISCQKLKGLLYGLIPF